MKNFIQFQHLYFEEYLITKQLSKLCYLILFTILIGVYIKSSYVVDFNPKNFSQITPEEDIGNQNGGFCKDIFYISDVLTSSSNDALKKAVSEIEESKLKKKFMSFDVYSSLASYLPSLIKEEKPNISNSVVNFTIPQETRLNQMNWKIPYLPCRLRQYAADDVHTCVQRKKDKQKQFRIAFIGDSRMRRPMEYLLELLHPYNLTLTTSKGQTLSVEQFYKDNQLVLKHKERFTVQSPRLPNLVFKFVWAPYLSRGDSGLDDRPYMKYLEEHAYFSPENNSVNDELISQHYSGAMDEFERMLQKPISLLPDYIFIDTSAWSLKGVLFENILVSFDKWAISGSIQLRSVLEKLASRTKVILLLPHPYKADFNNGKKKGVREYFTLQTNGNQEWYLNSQIQIFPQNILLWDSFIPVVFASNEDCKKISEREINLSLFPSILGFLQHNSYSCHDHVHVGQEAVAVAAQMILNQICNEDMDKHEDHSYCCEN